MTKENYWYDIKAYAMFWIKVFLAFGGFFK